MKIVVMLCLLFNFPVFLRANCLCKNKVTARVDTGEILKVVTTLIKNIKNDREKIKAIYEWVKTNISYDQLREKMSDIRYLQNRSIYETFELRKGICIDISRLTCYMLTLAKIKCEVISGFGKRNEHDFFVPRKELYHAWNAVFIDNKWLFMDPTWAHSNLDIDSKDNDFLVSPDFFIYSHYPEDEKWLLLSHPLSYSDFEQLPIVESRYFRYLKISPPKKGYYVTNEDFIIINDLPVDSSTFSKLTIRISEAPGNDFEEANYSLMNQREHSFFKVRIPEKGKYYIRIAGKYLLDDDFVVDIGLVTLLVERK